MTVEGENIVSFNEIKLDCDDSRLFAFKEDPECLNLKDH